MRALCLFLSLAGVLTSPPADACSPPPPFLIERVVPADGTANVPTNVQVRVVHGGSAQQHEAAVRNILVRRVGGDAVTATTSELRNSSNPYHRVYVVVPDAPLEPSTAYEIVSKVKPGCTLDCVSTTYEVLATFTTGAGPDVTPPTFGGVTEAPIYDFEQCTSSGCCGPYSGIPFKLKLGPATDDTGIAAYHVYRDGQLVSVYGLRGFHVCSGSFTGGGPGADFVYAASGHYSVHAVDLAGNEDDNGVEIPVTFSCPAPTLDGGVPTAAELTEPDDTSACAVGHRGRGAPAILLAFAAFLLRRHARGRTAV